MEVKSKGYFGFRSRAFVRDNSVINSAIRQSDYTTRLCAQIHDTLSVNGKVLMLTFTYNDANLPFCVHPRDFTYVPGFSREHVRKFLNNLKVTHYRKNRGSYKYFLCMEYGFRTKRAHYHALFFLSPDVDYRKFIDICREKWIYGYTFPAPHGNPYQTALLRYPSAGASYVAKYVTKDVSYYSLQSVIDLLEFRNDIFCTDKEKDYINNFLPRIYQSNGIGISLVEQLRSDFDNVCRNGVFNSLTKKFAPVPTYVLNNYFYSNVRAFDSRLGKKGNVLYDRVLKVDTQRFVDYKLSQLRKSVSGILPFVRGEIDVSSVVGNSDLQSCFSELSDLLQSSDSEFLAYSVAVYRSYVRCYNFTMRSYVADFSSLFSLDTVTRFLECQSDTYSRYLESSEAVSFLPLISTFTDDFSLRLFSCFDDIISSIELYDEITQVARIEKDRKNYELKSRHAVMRYPVNLC